MIAHMRRQNRALASSSCLKTSFRVMHIISIFLLSVSVYKDKGVDVYCSVYFRVLGQLFFYKISSLSLLFIDYVIDNELVKIVNICCVLKFYGQATYHGNRAK